jgi:predicted acylesterase/phospholipase RssA/proteasome lid subunit RPN8/RPN11
MERAEGGLPLRQRERLELLIPSDFPFKKPAVLAPHTRFARFPHVLWKHTFCLYQSPSTEWNPGDGMYGFIRRLDDWLRRGALGDWGVVGEAIHPPITRPGAGPFRAMIIPRVNTPPVEEAAWYGVAHLNKVSDRRIDITGWSPLFAEDSPANAAAAILLAEPMPFEFPDKVGDLLAELAARGVPYRDLLVTLQYAVLSNGAEDPLFVIVGTPMRGIRGDDPPKQHLTAWYLSPDVTKVLRLAIHSYKEDEASQKVGQIAEEIILSWAQNAPVEWCHVLEARPEAVTRRDYEAPASWFNGRAVSLWGCGALGGHVAEFLTRAGVRKLILRDDGVVKPGLLVRQPYDDSDIGRLKVVALTKRLHRLRPELDIELSFENLLTEPLDSSDWTDGADLIIETTGSEAVLGKLELKRRTTGGSRVPIVSMAIGHRAERGIVTLAGAGYSGGPFDVTRRAKLEACDRVGLRIFLDEFWPSKDAPRRRIFQPEPGCSDDTFVGSDADAATLAGTMLNLVAKDLTCSDPAHASAHFFAQPHTLSKPDERMYASFSWEPDRISIDPHAGFEIRVAESAWSDMMAWVSRSSRRAGPEIETGGLLFGERDEAARVIWVSEVIGPPPDSRSSALEFLCGAEGTAEANAEKKKRTRESVQYVGMWHSHPGSSPQFSPTDFEGMRQTIETAGLSPSKSLLLIIGTPESAPTVGTYVFSRADFARFRESGYQVRSIALTLASPPTVKPRRIGLSLSGGGSRAIAFHLGCLRALHDRGLMPQVDVISSVSGGSVITAMYAYSNDSFEEFDARTVKLLRRGLMGGILRRALISPRLPATLATQTVAGTAAVGADLLRFLLSVSSRALGRGKSSRAEKIHAPFRRWTSLTMAFERTLRDKLFKDIVLTSPRRADLHVVLNACELRTGSAFRFGSEISGCWRFGQLASSDVPISLAVAASAAYPLLLPAIDRKFQFIDRKGKASSKRVFLTDGGVFDNFGVTCLEPGRSGEYSYHTYCPEYIICCDAGQGLFGDQVYPYHWASRMQRSFETVYRKAHDHIRQRLHACVDSGKLKGFVLAYLGQMDQALPLIPPDLIKREEVYKYPTDFSPMSMRDIELLTARGEQLTRLLISRYCPEL